MNTCPRCGMFWPTPVVSSQYCDDCLDAINASQPVPRELRAFGGPIDGATVPLSMTPEMWVGFVWLHVPVLSVAGLRAAIYARDGDLLLYVDADDYQRETHGGNPTFRIDPGSITDD